MFVQYKFKRAVYESLPLSIKRLVLLIPFQWIAGSSYDKVFRRGDWFDHASRKDILSFQEEQLSQVLHFAVELVPAYKHLKSLVGRFRPFEAIKEFPLISKDDLQSRLSDYLPDNYSEIPHYETSTGGTSGNQLKVYLDDDSQSVELAFMHRQWQRVGYSPKKRKATFRGVTFGELKPNVVYWQHNPVYNELQFSPFHMNEKTLGRYIDELLRYKPSYLHGYPSAIDMLAEYVLRHGLQGFLPDLKAMLLGSEGASTAQRERIGAAFGARVYSWYGHSERVILAGECEKNSTYHHFPDYGFLEIVDDAGKSCNSEGERGEIIGTGFYKRCMPLIRYRTGDYATRLEPDCDCGRKWDRFTNVEGHRKQEMLHGKNGEKISLAALNMHGPLFEQVTRYQYYQEKPGEFILKIVPAPDFSESDRKSIEAEYRKKVRESLVCSVELVDEIPLTARGKLKMLDSRLNS